MSIPASAAHYSAEITTGVGVGLSLLGQITDAPAASAGGVWVALIGLMALVIRLWADDRREKREKDRSVAELKATNAALLAELAIARRLCAASNPSHCPLKIVPNPAGIDPSKDA